MMRRLLLILCLFSMSVFASKIPVITSIVQSGPDASAHYKYTFTQQVLEVGSAGDVIVPTGWMVGIMSKHYNGSVMQAAIETNYVRSINNDTFSKLSLQAYNEPPTSLKKVTYFWDVKSDCIGWGSQRAIYITWGDGQIFPMGCMVIPPTTEWCKITTPEILLDHGTLTLRNAENSSVSTQMGVHCTTSMAVKFNLVVEDKYIYLDEGKSEITVNNLPLNSKIDLPQGDANMLIKDLLTGINSEGFHTGSSVLVMMPY